MAIGEFRYLKGVTTLALDTNKCTGCGMCEIVCPHRIFAVADRKAIILDRDKCMECGACAVNCPAEAITVNAGVGCATAVLIGAIRGTEPTCGCSDNGSSCCGGRV